MFFFSLLLPFVHRFDSSPTQPTQVAKSDERNERTIFQTGSTYNDRINLRADVAVVYGFGNNMPARVKAWRDRGYKVHLMTGVAWGEYQDYYYGRWDGIHHEDEAQTRKNGEKVGHGGDVYYMSPGKNYGRYLADGIRKALEVGVEAVHLEEPEFWTYGGYGEGFKREWQDYYHEAWRDPESSPDARWRTAKLMYYLYRRALQQVFDSIQEFNQSHHTHVRCYVATHSLLNYSQWGIVSPESSLALLKGCDGYIAQVWTGTARTPNYYQGVKKERTFETAFLEYGAMQNLVRSTGRSVWYLADPIEDDPNHDWGDYRRNWHSTLTASLLQPDVSQYEVMPWPERIFNGTYPSESDKAKRVAIPETYATELQVVIRALKDMNQKPSRWESGTRGVGVLISDSLLFQRGAPSSSDDDLGQVYGLALPFLKRGIPVDPVQLENTVLPGYLSNIKVLLMTYEGMKPLTPAVHTAIARWVKDGGHLVVVDRDSDPYLKVREWWNTAPMAYASPREHLFATLGIPSSPVNDLTSVGKGTVLFLRKNPSELSHDPSGGDWLVKSVQTATSHIAWKESPALTLIRGPYVISAGLDEASGRSFAVNGTFIDCFSPNLEVQDNVIVEPGSRHLLVDLSKLQSRIVAAAGAVTDEAVTAKKWHGAIEGIARTQGILVLRSPRLPKEVTINGEKLTSVTYDQRHHLLYLRFPNQARPQPIDVRY